MVRVQAGDPQALSALIDRWRGPLYAFLWRRAGDGADDLFQESWIRVARARDRFDRSRRFSTWLFQIANNLCRDRWRRQDARRRALDALREETLHDRARRAPQPPRCRPSGARRAGSKRCPSGSARCWCSATTRTWARPRSPRSSASRAAR